MNIHQLIKERISTVSKEKIVKELEYNSQARGLKSLNAFLEYKTLYSWIYSGHYDFKYTAITFFEKLVEIFCLNKKDITAELDRCKEINLEIDRYQNSYIFINTNFKRSTQPIFALCMLESKRNLVLPIEELIFKSDEEVFKIISLIVLQHYKNSDGKIGIWGTTINYIYHHSDGKTYTFDINGNRIENDRNVCESRATLTINGKDLPCGQMN